MADENENIDSEDDEYFPPYICHESKTDMFIQVFVSVKGLTVSNEIVFESFLPKMVEKPTNATVDVIFEDRSFCLKVVGEDGDMKWKNINWTVKKLPYEIIPDESYYEVGNDKVKLFLHKNEDRSWYPELDNGLETVEDNKEDEPDS